MVSGSDCHGTPITVAADKEGVDPRVIVDRYHAKILEVWERFGISFDLYTSTLTENHYAVTQDVFLGYFKLDGKLTGAASPFTVLYQMATYQSVDRLRRRAVPAGGAVRVGREARVGQIRRDDEEGRGRAHRREQLEEPGNRRRPHEALRALVEQRLGQALNAAVVPEGVEIDRQAGEPQRHGPRTISFARPKW